MKEVDNVKKAMVIINPSSGKEEAEEFLIELKTILARNFAEIIVKETEEKGDAEKFARNSGAEGVDTVIAMGGDGTVHEVVNGLMHTQQPVTLGVVPLGTVNNFARAAGIPARSIDAVQALSDAETVTIDTGKIQDTYFISSVSAGPMPETVLQVDSDLKTKFGPLAYVLEGIKALDEDTVYPFKITLDGKVIKENYSLIVIALSNSVVGIHNFISQASLIDGNLYFLGLKEAEVSQKLALVPKLFQENNDYSDKVDVIPFMTAHFEVANNQPLGTTVDGESGPDFPADIEVKAQSLKILVPRSQ